MSSIKDIVEQEEIKNINNDMSFKIIAILIVSIVIVLALFFTTFWNIPGIGNFLHFIYGVFAKLMWEIASFFRRIL